MVETSQRRIYKADFFEWESV